MHMTEDGDNMSRPLIQYANTNNKIVKNNNKKITFILPSYFS